MLYNLVQYCTTMHIVTFPTINDSTRYVYKWIVSYAYYLVQLLCKSPQSCTGPTDRGCAKRCMHTRVQQRVLYSESAQVRLGEGRGRFDDKKIRVGPAYQAVIPVLTRRSRSHNRAESAASESTQTVPAEARDHGAPPRRHRLGRRRGWRRMRGPLRVVRVAR